MTTKGGGINNDCVFASGSFFLMGDFVPSPFVTDVQDGGSSGDAGDEVTRSSVRHHHLEIRHDRVIHLTELIFLMSQNWFPLYYKLGSLDISEFVLTIFQKSRII